MEFRTRRALCALIAIIASVTVPAAPGADATHATVASQVAAATPSAEPAPDSPPTTQPLTWLKSANYTALDHYYSTLQSQYESGAASEETLYNGFRRLYEDSSANERYFDAWVDAYPKSYAARLARGTYYYRMAWFIRGSDYISATPRNQIETMTAYLSQAQPELVASMKLTAKPYLSALYLLNVTLMDGSQDENRHWYEVGTRIAPTNTRLRVRYMSSLRPRWGGSYADMHEFLEECRKQNPDPKLLAKLQIVIHSDKAEDAMRADEQSGSKTLSTEVFDEWKKVIDLSQAAGEEPSSEALAGYTRAASDLHLKADADRGLALLAKRNIDDGWSLERMAWVLIQQHRDAEALPSLQKAAVLNQPWSQFVLGKTIYQGCPELNIPADQKAGQAWIERSAHLCHPEAVEFLTSHGLPGGCESLAGSNGALLRRLPMWWSAGLGQGVGGAVVIALVFVLMRRRRDPPDAP